MSDHADTAERVAEQEIRFVLDGEIVRVRDLSPQTTLLEFLREHLGRVGTKEGCAEGDCGACTVVLADNDVADGLSWRPINACIRPLPTVDGKALFTVESLKDSDGTLHPVQQALVDCHASQCGFCTPGFVMSLFGLYKNASRADARRDRRCALGQSLPLHRVSADHRCRRANGLADGAEGMACSRRGRRRQAPDQRRGA